GLHRERSNSARQHGPARGGSGRSILEAVGISACGRFRRKHLIGGAGPWKEDVWAQRATFARFTLDQTLESFVRCHVEAFEAFGGVPREALYDNLEAVVFASESDASDAT